jgi:hypothetical protein
MHLVAVLLFVVIAPLVSPPARGSEPNREGPRDNATSDYHELEAAARRRELEKVEERVRASEANFAEVCSKFGLSAVRVDDISQLGYAATWELLIESKEKIAVARKRLDMSASMTESELSAVATFYPTWSRWNKRVTDAGLVGTAEGLVMQFQIDWEVATAEAGAVERALGINEATTSLTPEAIAEIDAALRDLKIARRIGRTIKEGIHSGAQP